MRVVILAWLFVRPVFDEVTEITYDEAEDAINYLREKGIEVIDLGKERAIRENVERVLTERPDVGIAHYNHGSEDKIWGNDERPIVDLKNVNLLSGRECYNNNCSSAKKLGVEAWKLGAVYWGYDDVFYFTTDSLEEFKEAVNCGIKRRVDSLSWGECLQKTKEKMTELADKLLKAGKALAASCMRYDRDHLVCYNANPPQPSCPFRKLAVKLLGIPGWNLTRRYALALLFFGVGLGVALHDYCHALWQVGGYREILSPQGGYIGFSILTSAFLIAIWEYVRWLKKR